MCVIEEIKIVVLGIPSSRERESRAEPSREGGCGGAPQFDGCSAAAAVAAGVF